MNQDRNSGSFAAQSSSVYTSSPTAEQSPLDQWSRQQYAQQQTTSYTYPPPLPEGSHFDGQHRSGRVASSHHHHGRPPLLARHDSAPYYPPTYPSQQTYPQEQHQRLVHPQTYSRDHLTDVYRSSGGQHPSPPPPVPAAAYQAGEYHPEHVYPQPRVQRAMTSESGTPVKCPECDAIFSRQHDMKRHASSVHAKTKHVCPKCAKEFSRQDSVSRHIKDNRCSASANAQQQQIPSS